MKRKEIDRRLTQLLDRIDGELSEIRDGLIEVDHKAGEAHHAYRARDAAIGDLAVKIDGVDQRVRQLERDDADHSVKA